MKQILRTLCSVLVASVFASLAWSNLPVTFNLQVDPAGVAIQFDVTSESPLSSIGFPTFEGATDHSVRSATVESGAHRFVVFSQTGDPITTSGEVNVVFAPALAPGDGVISLSNITASNADGQVVTASPNALPILTQALKPHQSLELGASLQMNAVAYDLDGAMKTVKLLSGSDELDMADADPFSLGWTPGTAGSFALSVVATDNRDQQSTFDLGVLRAYSDSEITNFGNFASIHFGDSPSDGGFEADPLGNGYKNGFAYLLGLNPHSPDLSRLPTTRLERTDDGVDLILTFVRRSNVSGIDWNARETRNLQTYENVEASRISETDRQDGTHAVELRLPLDTDTFEPTFVDLEVNQS